MLGRTRILLRPPEKTEEREGPGRISQITHAGFGWKRGPTGRGGEKIWSGGGGGAKNGGGAHTHTGRRAGSPLPDIAVTVASLVGLKRNYTATEGGWGRDRKCRLEGDVSSSSSSSSSSSRPQKMDIRKRRRRRGRMLFLPSLFFRTRKRTGKRTKKKKRCHSILFSPDKGRRFAEENVKKVTVVFTFARQQAQDSSPIISHFPKRSIPLLCPSLPSAGLRGVDTLGGL